MFMSVNTIIKVRSKSDSLLPAQRHGSYLIVSGTEQPHGLLPLVARMVILSHRVITSLEEERRVTKLGFVARLSTT